MNDDLAAALIIAAMVIASGFGVKGCLGMEAQEKALLYNKVFKTDYTEHQMFWVGGQIKKLHESRVPERPMVVQADLNVRGVTFEATDERRGKKKRKR